MTMSVMYYRIIFQFVTRQPRGDMAQKVRFNTIALARCVLSSISDEDEDNDDIDDNVESDVDHYW